MIQTIRIQNFRSLQDVTLNLQDVNLLIGPNNSGKSNLMKAFEFLGKLFNDKIPEDEQQLKNYFYLRNLSKEYSRNSKPIAFTIVSDGTSVYEFIIYKIEIFGINNLRKEIALRQFIGIVNKDKSLDLEKINLNNINSLRNDFGRFEIQYEGLDFFRHSSILKLDFDKINHENIKISVSNELAEIKIERSSSFKTFADENLMFTGLHDFRKILSQYNIYSVDISNLKKPYPTLEDDYSVKPDASNLVAFLDNMRDNKPDIMDAINTSLNECIKEFKSISFEKVALSENHDLRKIHGDKTFKRLGVQDIHGQIYWADELSDGTLYFLALLAIIHQPNPPKLLMVEEPENGIHPRRIKELMDYFFEIAEKQEIKVILTTHSTVVIDQFTDLPESVFVFDKKDQATTIKNLKTDIIAEDEKQSEKLNVPKLDLSQSLGDHWASGLIGGVPR